MLSLFAAFDDCSFSTIRVRTRAISFRTLADSLVILKLALGQLETKIEQFLAEVRLLLFQLVNAEPFSSAASYRCLLSLHKLRCKRQFLGCQHKRLFFNFLGNPRHFIQHASLGFTTATQNSGLPFPLPFWFRQASG